MKNIYIILFIILVGCSSPSSSPNPFPSDSLMVKEQKFYLMGASMKENLITDGCMVKEHGLRVTESSM